MKNKKGGCAHEKTDWKPVLVDVFTEVQAWHRQGGRRLRVSVKSNDKGDWEIGEVYEKTSIKNAQLEELGTWLANYQPTA